MRNILAMTAAGVVGAAAVGVPAVASARTGTVMCKASFTGHPENSSPPWAYDTFTRTTRFTPVHGGYKAVIHDRGTFTTVPGVKSDSGDVLKSKVTGRFSGTGVFLVTTTDAPACKPGESYDGTDDPSTSQWPVHYFTKATTDGITGWEWTYRTCREWMIETEKGVSGHLTGVRCRPRHTPSPTPTPTPSSTPTETPSPTPTATTPAGNGEAPAPTPVKTDLPVTG